MSATTLISIFSDLQQADTRRAGAQALAVHAGVEDVLIFSQDPEIEVFLPVPGLPQTLPEGGRWQQFLTESARSGCGLSLLPLADNSEDQPIFALADTKRLCIIAFVGEPDMQKMPEIGMLLPLLGAKFIDEQSAIVAHGQARVERNASQRAHELNQILESSRQQLRQAWQRSEQELDARRRQDREADENEHRKNAFLFMLSRELRDPLGPINDALKIIELLTPSAPEPARLARIIIAEQTRHLDTLVSDLMDLARIMAGEVALSMDSLDATDIIRQAVELHAQEIDEHGQQLLLHGLEHRHHVRGDARRLLRIFGGLIHNASGHTPPGGTISVSLQSNGEQLMISITDSGIGMSPALLHDVFELFACTADDTIKGEGLRVSLYLARRLIELHGGTLEASSAGDTSGSCFTIRLPLQT